MAGKSTEAIKKGNDPSKAYPIAEAIKLDGGTEAVQLRVAEQYIKEFGKLVEGSTNLVLPANAADVGSMVALAMNVFKQQGGDAAPPAPPAVPHRR